MTFDGRNYDFQAVGEFTLVKSRSGDLEVQARQQQARTVAGVPSDTVSVNTGLAMRVGRARVGVYATRSGMRVRVNGRQMKTPTGGARLSLPRGGALADRAGQLAVLWPDGSEARVWSLGTSGLAVMMLPAPARAGELIGLLGNFDGKQANDFATRAGRRLNARALLGSGGRAFKLLYGTFGDSWRIRQRDSLFDYRRGRSTRGYTRRGFPRRPLSAGSLPPALRRHAEAICRAAGVSDPTVLQNCILDVAATGNPAFARDAATLEATARPRVYTLEGALEGDPNSAVSVKLVLENGRPERLERLTYRNLDATCIGAGTTAELSGDGGENVGPSIEADNTFRWISYPGGPGQGYANMFGEIQQGGTLITATLEINDDGCLARGNATLRRVTAR